MAALYNDGYIHTTAITVIGEYRPPSIRVFFSVSSLTYRYHSIVIADSVRGSIRFVAALYDGYIRTTDISVIGEYRPPSIRVFFSVSSSSNRPISIVIADSVRSSIRRLY